MKKNWRKIVIPLLIIAVVVMVTLTAKSILGKESGTRTSDISESGVVSSSVFKKLMSSNDMMMFNGESEGIN